MPADRALVDRVLAGEAHAFGALVERYQGSLYAFIKSRIADAAAAEDLTQDVLLAAFDHLASLHAKERFGAWLFGIARGKVRQHARDRARRRVHTGGELDRIEAPEGGDAAAGGEGLEALLVGLSDEERVVMLLRFADGLSYREIAERLGMPMGTVATMLRRGRERAAHNHRKLNGATL